jgi:hypothetical protein
MVCIGEKLFGVTAAHAFFDDIENGESTERGESTEKDTMEFSLEDEDEDSDEYEEGDDSVDVTSRGELSLISSWMKTGLIQTQEAYPLCNRHQTSGDHWTAFVPIYLSMNFRHAQKTNPK